MSSISPFRIRLRVEFGLHRGILSLVALMRTQDVAAYRAPLSTVPLGESEFSCVFE